MARREEAQAGRDVRLDELHDKLTNGASPQPVESCRGSGLV